MKLSFALFVAAAACTVPAAVVAFVPTTAAARPVSQLAATVDKTAKLTPPKKIADLADNCQDVYAKNVQPTYG
jgi:hypothetical protein